jgi:hypothetical protein
VGSRDGIDARVKEKYFARDWQVKIRIESSNKNVLSGKACLTGHGEGTIRYACSSDGLIARKGRAEY